MTTATKPVEELTQQEMLREISERKGGTELMVSPHGDLYAEFPGKSWAPVANWPGDLNAAWELAEELRGMGEFELYGNRNNKSWLVRMSNHLDSNIRVEAETPALAICRAWLKVKREER